VGVGLLELGLGRLIVMLDQVRVGIGRVVSGVVRRVWMMPVNMLEGVVERRGWVWVELGGRFLEGERNVGVLHGRW
jgi:hypothetical protein